MIGAIFLIVCIVIATSFSIYTIIKINELLKEIYIEEIKNKEEQQ